MNVRMLVVAACVAATPALAAEPVLKPKTGDAVIKKQDTTPSVPKDSGTKVTTPAVPGKDGRALGGASSTPTSANPLPGAGGSTEAAKNVRGSGKTVESPLGAKTQPESGGKKVSPGDFSKEQQLRDLANYGKDKLDQGAGKTEPGRKSPGDLLKGSTPHASDGKNTTTKRGQQSDGDSGAQPVPYPNTTETPKPSPVKQDAPVVKSEPPGQTKGDEAGTLKGVASPTTMGPATRPVGSPTVRIQGGIVTPNPDAPVDAPGAPAAIRGATPTKSPDQIEAERRRQTTVPGEGRQPEKVVIDPAEAAGAMVGRRTDGRINPARGDDGTTSGSGAVRGPRLEQIDQHGPQRPGTPGASPTTPSGGSSPDNPTASDGQTSSGTPGQLPRP